MPVPEPVWARVLVLAQGPELVWARVPVEVLVLVPARVPVRVSAPALSTRPLLA